MSQPDPNPPAPSDVEIVFADAPDAPRVKASEILYARRFSKDGRDYIAIDTALSSFVVPSNETNLLALTSANVKLMEEDGSVFVSAPSPPEP